jgi:hypothetical protein
MKFTNFVRRAYGLLGWTGDAETVRRVALDPEFGVLESRHSVGIIPCTDPQLIEWAATDPELDYPPPREEP